MTAIETRPSSSEVPAEIQERVMVTGDLKSLSPEQRMQLYVTRCERLGLDWTSQPFQYLELGKGRGKKLVLYATKTATDQLRKLHRISMEITKSDTFEANGDYYAIVEVTGKAYIGTPHERIDADMAVVPLFREIVEWVTGDDGRRFPRGTGRFEPLRGDDLGNAMMKATTKAKRRLTLSMTGAGALDETEVETIKDAAKVDIREAHDEIAPPAPVEQVVESTGEIIETDEDMDWTEFWTYAAGMGFSAQNLEQRTSIDVKHLTPHEAYLSLHQHLVVEQAVNEQLGTDEEDEEVPF